MTQSKDPKTYLAYRMLVFIRDKGEASISDLQSAFGVSRTRTHRALEMLRNYEVVYPYMRGIYRVTDKGKPPERQ